MQRARLYESLLVFPGWPIAWNIFVSCDASSLTLVFKVGLQACVVQFLQSYSGRYARSCS